MTQPGVVSSLVRACHPGPTVAVTVLAVLLAVSVGLPPTRVVVLGVAVLTGQLTIGWTNDLLDARRDAAVGRTDKPIARGEVSRSIVVRTVVVAAVVCVGSSALLGWRPALVHLLLLVGSGWAYNLGLKRTALSFLPYAVAFGALPAVVLLSDRARSGAPLWIMITGALLGVGAHLVNALPDLADDAATGVRGLPHRLGARWSRALAAALLLAGVVVSIVGPDATPPGWVWVVLALSAVLAVVIVLGRGRNPFRAAVAVALLVVLVLLQRAADLR